MRRTWPIAGAPLLVVLTSLLPSAAWGWQGEADDDAFEIINDNASPGSAGSGTPDPDVAYLRSGTCPNPAPGTLDTPICPDGVGPVLTVTCLTAEAALPPLWVRTRDATTPTGWTPWTLIPNSSRCLDDPTTPVLTATDFRRLPLTPSEIHIEPPTGWTLANIPTIVYTSNTPQTLPTTVLGLAVTVRATPISYTWDFDDHSPPLTTTDPGHPYPDPTLTHTYRTDAVHHLTVTTTWTGEFLVDGHTTWHPITGTAQTRTTSTPLTVHTARTHLVADPT